MHIYVEIEGRHANVKAHEAVDRLTNFLSSREEISQPNLLIKYIRVETKCVSIHDSERVHLVL